MEDLRAQIFFLAYHLHWGHEELMDLASHERHEFVRLLADQIERENARIAAAGSR